MSAATAAFMALSATTFEGAKVPATSLVSPGGAVVFVIRRMGGLYCREEAIGDVNKDK